VVRPRKKRQVNFFPRAVYFKPQNIPLASLREINLTLDELEALRLVDWQGLGQTEAGEKMNISQSTLQRILKEARQKIAGALVKGQAIRVEGGEVTMPGFGRGLGRGQGLGRGLGRGGGRGRQGGPYAAGPGGVCVCTNPDCKNEVSHLVGQPCYQRKCPKCGSPMVRR